ncbi:S8 family peptidase [Pseudomonas fragi]|nr:S8 family peptidase [Pseudomonas fragi]
MQAAVDLQRATRPEGGFGLQIEFQSEVGYELAFESLARGQQHIELMNLRRDPLTKIQYATVFIPDGQLKAFEKLVQDYLHVNTDKGNPRNAPLLNPIHQIRVAAFNALWTDDPKVLPDDENEKLWWEFWLPVRESREAVLNRFLSIAEACGFETSDKPLYFPERTVLNVWASRAAITQSLSLLNEVAEIRRAKDTAEFFDALPPVEQREWVDELLARLVPAASDCVRVCLLDTGVNTGHPLLFGHIDRDDLYTVNEEWGFADDAGHGTELAGIALYGDMVEPLNSQALVEIEHRLESVKLLPSAVSTQKEPYGRLTIDAVTQPETSKPDVRRVFSMAITSLDDRDRGRPSAWSAAIDELACDVLGEGANPRLIIVSAGNADQNQAHRYPHSNAVDGINDPAQAWNAICVGAYTRKVTIDPPNAAIRAIAAAESLSPFSTTSMTWNNTAWPLKPDVVFEGGNLGTDGTSAFNEPSLSLLTTAHNLNDRLFTTTRATSAASAMAARMAAQICTTYPHFRPETIRALMIHSAEWPERMRQDFLTGNSKAEYEKLVKQCGFGVPDIGRAIWSASDSLTMIVEDEIRPFMRQGTKPPTARDMHLHSLPWPREELLALGNENVEMRVTLSYFVEPNPGVVERGIKGRYRYESHGLRFDVSRPNEDKDQFRQRINKRARDEEEGAYQGGGSDPNWLLGPQTRHRGSVHSDTWRGSAAELAGRGMLGIYPALGWWKTLVKQQRYDDTVKYSLIVSIKTRQTEVDLYAAVENVIAAKTAVLV